MSFEIERKFLVVNDAWRPAVTDSDVLRDGLISENNGAKVRVRLGLQAAWLAVKSSRTGPSRLEFEYEIPRPDAEEMLTTVCGERVVEKARYRIDHAASVWTVDVYRGLLSGIVLAEIELESEEQVFERPDWIGLEVTNNPRFHKWTIARLCREAGRPLTVAELLVGHLQSGLFMRPP